MIIGGTACSIMLRHADMKPRATKDIDMILVVERMTPEFGRRFGVLSMMGIMNRERKNEVRGKSRSLNCFGFIDLGTRSTLIR